MNNSTSLNIEKKRLFDADHPLAQIAILDLTNNGGVNPITELRECLCQKAAQIHTYNDVATFREIVSLKREPTPLALNSLDKAFLALRDEGAILRYLYPLLIEVIPNNNPMAVVELGLPRIIVDDDILESMMNISEFNKRFSIPQQPDLYSCTTISTNASPPHRDLARPHFSTQYNLWFPLHDLDALESITIFPEALTQDIFPFSRKDLDPNQDMAEIRHMMGSRSFGQLQDQLQLGKFISPPLKTGQIVLFHSEHFHASPLNRSRIRFSVDIRFAVNCPDDNSHYRRKSFFRLSNFASMPRDKSAFCTPYEAYRELDHPDALQVVANNGNADLIVMTARTLTTKRRINFLHSIFDLFTRLDPGYFWLWELAKLYREADLHKEALVLTESATADAMSFKISFNHNPVDYHKPPYGQYLQSTVSPEHVIKEIKKTPQIVEENDEYNIVVYRNQYFGIPKSVGFVDFDKSNVGKIEGVNIGDSLTEVTTKIKTQINPK